MFAPDTRRKRYDWQYASCRYSFVPSPLRQRAAFGPRSMSKLNTLPRIVVLAGRVVG